MVVSALLDHSWVAARPAWVAVAAAAALLLACSGAGEIDGGAAVSTPTAGDLPASAPTPDTVESATPTPDSTALAGRIAYVTSDLRVWTVNPDGSDKWLATPEEGRYSWPTWAPDGETLAYSAATGEGAEAEVRLVAEKDGGGIRRVLYTGDPEYAGILVAPNLPHYAVWSPDGERLALISGGQGGLVVYVDDLRDAAPPAPVASMAPVYLSWSASSRYVLVHRGGHLLLVDADEAMAVTPLPHFAANYRAPAWRPSGDVMTAVGRDDRTGNYSVYTREVAAEDSSFIARAAYNMAFLWSPAGDWLALGRGSTPRLPIYEELVLVSPDGGLHPVRIEEGVISFFWSPDGSMLAYVTTTDIAGVWVWNVLHVESGEKRRLAEFIPSDDLLVWLQFFDQFAYSHPLWSPDSRAIVFSGRVAGGAVGASTNPQQVDRVIVLTVDRLPSAEAIAEGTMAFWSP